MMPGLMSTDLRVAEERTRLALAGLQAWAQELNRISDAVARMLDTPGGAAAADPVALGDLGRDLVPRWHFAMLNDRERNDALAVALERVIPRGATVLDIGAGTGLLAMMAVRAGAARVYSCEANPLMAELARQVIADHGLAEVVTVLPCRSDRLRVGQELPHRVDAVISEIVDCGLIGEGILPSLRHAREHLLADGGVLLPCSAVVRAALLQSEIAAGLNRVGRASGFDVSRLNALATAGHFPIRLHTWPHRLLSEPFDVAQFDFGTGALGPGRQITSVPVTGNGTVHAVVSWFELHLGGAVTLSNSPENVCSHWMQALIPLPEPVEAAAGSTLTLDFAWSDTRFSVH